VLTLPPTDSSISGSSSAGSSLLLVLAALGILILAIGLVTPPATIRRRR
jgi:hypothetical protein